MFNQLVILAFGVSVLHLTSCSEPVEEFEVPRPCKRYDGDGCSIPFGLPFFYKRQFTRSCDRHDICYHCGVAYNIPRVRCDNAFRNNTQATCKSKYLSSTRRRKDKSYPTGDTIISSDLHQARFLWAVQESGTDGLSQALETEIAALNQAHHPGEPNFKDFTAWFSDHKVQVRVLAEWARILYAKHLRVDSFKSRMETDRIDLSRRPSVKENLLTLVLANDADIDIDRLWCSDVVKYLKARNETGPLFSMTCPDIGYLTCNFFSEVYFLAVRIFAYSSYDKEPEFYCHQKFVPKCLPPLPALNTK